MITAVCYFCSLLAVLMGFFDIICGDEEIFFYSGLKRIAMTFFSSYWGLSQRI